jgi:hypothetical protein
MDAVADADRVSFEQHLAGCEPCREEIRGLREATARLAAAAAVQPRPEIREQTLRAAARTRQLPPAVREGAVAAVAGQPVRPAAGILAAVRQMTRGGRLRRAVLRAPAGPLPRLALALGGALTAAIVVLAVMMHGTQHQLDQAQRRSQAIAAVLSAADVTRLTADVRTGGTATVMMSARQRSLVFTAHGLRALPVTRSYELWLMSPDGARPAGMLPGSRAGMVGPMVVSGLAAGDRIGLTVESADGSARPTSTPVLLLALDHG